MSYVGRFAPSPTGPLHAGSLVAALASWLDARAYALQHPGERSTWLVRIEDVDQPRSVPGADHIILRQLADCGLVSDAPVLWQSQRSAAYQAALDQLVHSHRAYPCGCSRQDIARASKASGLTRQRHGELRYPGSCRGGLKGQLLPAWRFAVTPLPAVSAPHKPVSNAAVTPRTVVWHDRRLGAQQQDVDHEVGDFVLRRADACFAYQLAVVVDDAAQGVSHVVRGDDLADNTARQIGLQQALGLPTPRYLHTPLVRAANGEKLSKQTGAAPLDTRDPQRALQAAASALDLPQTSATPGDALAQWIHAWAERYPS